MTYSDRALEVGQRIAKIRVHHTKFATALDAIAHALQVGNCVSIPVGINVIAPAGTGKTFLIESVRNNVCKWPFLPPNSVLYASLKELPSVGQIQAELLASFRYVIAPKTTRNDNSDVFRLLVDSIIQHDIRLIAIDEYHHVFLARKAEARRNLIDWTKRLQTHSQRPVLLAGTEALRSIEKGDEQLTSRAPTVISLPAFKNDEQWIGLLIAFAEMTKDVDLSPIHAEFAKAVFRATGGMMRLLKRLLVEVAMIVIDANEVAVKKDHLRLAFQRVFGTDTSLKNPF
jgi:hypothetical protein